MKNRIRETVLLLSALLAIAGIPASRRTPRGPWRWPRQLPRQPSPCACFLGRARGPTFFPHNWLRGYVDFDVAPPHNEPDLGRCSPSSTVIVSAGGANSNCNAYARYLWSGYLEVQPFGKTFARHVFCVLHAHVFLWQ